MGDSEASYVITLLSLGEKLQLARRKLDHLFA